MKKILLGLIGLLFAVPGWATNLPSGYTELEYIESTGTQYIDTGISGFNTGDWEIYAKWMTTVSTQPDSYGFIFGVYKNESHNSYRLIFNLTKSGEYYISANSRAGGGSIAVSASKNAIHNIVVKNGSFVLDGQNYQAPNAGTALPSDSKLGIFRCDENGSYAAKGVARLYSMSVKKDGVLIGDFVSAKNSSGVVGLYDTVSGNFFTNAGTGTFTAGPEVSIRIATTAYNSARFSPVVTELNDTIATIRSVVTNTINQTAAIADLQATKQTRPDETCPAGKKCLLVEDDDGTPYWFEIVESAD
ncbi:MAG: hypothetical protein IJS34_02610 [Alphaproteobacteria bacterium]|nr:hypothetical protein [Alphaproteobacteria bacterium]